MGLLTAIKIITTIATYIVMSLLVIMNIKPIHDMASWLIKIFISQSILVAVVVYFFTS